MMYRYSRENNGIINYLTSDGTNERIGGVTYMRGGWFPKSTVYMSPFNTKRNFIIALNHELIHAWQWRGYGNKMKTSEWNVYKEASAWANTRMYHPTCTIPAYYGNYNLYNWPLNLIFVP